MHFRKLPYLLSRMLWFLRVFCWPVPLPFVVHNVQHSMCNVQQTAFSPFGLTVVDVNHQRSKCILHYIIMNGSLNKQRTAHSRPVRLQPRCSIATFVLFRRRKMDEITAVCASHKWYNMFEQTNYVHILSKGSFVCHSIHIRNVIYKSECYKQCNE